MRVIIAIIIFITILNSCESLRNSNMKGYIKTINKSVDNACNKEAYKITKNSDMYNCLIANNTNNCRHIENFTTYINTKEVCTLKYNSELGSGIFIAIFGWAIMMLLCVK